MAYALGATSQVLSVIATSAKFTVPMIPGQIYLYVCTVDSWIATAATGGAAAVGTANSHFVPAGAPRLLKNPETSEIDESFVHAIRGGSTSGTASLSPIGPG